MIHDVSRLDYITEDDLQTTEDDLDMLEDDQNLLFPSN